MILSLQGCMAVGKTTVVRYLQENAPYVNISYEINEDVLNVDHLNADEFGKKVKEWGDFCIEHY